MATFEQLVHVVRRLSNRRMVGSALLGDLLIDSEATLENLRACEAAFEDTDLSLETASVAVLAVGQTVQVRLGTPRPAFGLVRKDLDELLRFPAAHVREPAKYVLWETGFCHSDTVVEGDAVDRYRKVLALIQVLKGAAAFLDEQEEILVFIRGGKFEVPLRYTAADLEAMDLAELDTVIGAIPEGTHKAQCESILAESMHEVLVKHPAAERFGHFLRGLPEIHERFDRGYRLFAAGFSYEKLRDQVEAARIEYTGKMHKVFSDIQNQLLGIPVATVIVATQMKPHSQVASEFWISVAVLLGSFVFALLVHLLLRNQRHTLEVVGLEIARQRKELEKQPQGVAANLLPTFELLERRYRTQMRILQAIDWVVLAGVALSVFFFYQLSGPARQWVDESIFAASSM
jgi:hypothetical protein